ncbi:hypothetical protein ACGH2B_23210 [Streptomyces sp. BBFR2]|uniref:hypothetical protein n=1 Tax=Streptomyces sp. BBFR2 TaxID=3372854 RepID=UPI0037DA10F7
MFSRMLNSVVTVFSRSWRYAGGPTFPFTFGLPYLLSAGLASRVRLSCRSFGVRFSISGPVLTWKIKDSSRAFTNIPLFGVVSAVHLPAFAFLAAVVLATPLVRRAYESQFGTLGERDHFYLALALFVFAVLWWPMEVRRVRDIVREESARTAFYHCCRCLADCRRAREGKISLLQFDAQIHRFGRVLVRFGRPGPEWVSPERRRQLAEHTARLAAALDAGSARVLEEGDEALSELARLLARVLERLAQERWLALLDESELPAYQPPSAEDEEAEIRQADSRVVLVGATAAAVLVGVMISLGVPAGAVVPAALIFLLGPATIWGSKKLGSPRQLLDAMRGGVTQPPEAPQPNGAPAAAPAVPSPAAPASGGASRPAG